MPRDLVHAGGTNLKSLLPRAWRGARSSAAGAAGAGDEEETEARADAPWGADRRADDSESDEAPEDAWDSAGEEDVAE